MKHPKSYSLPVSLSSSSSAPPSPTSHSADNAGSRKPSDSSFLPSRSIESELKSLAHENIGFVELLGRSNFSFLQGGSHPEEMVLRAKKLGYQGLALSDVNGFYGVVRGYQAAEKPSFFDAEQLAILSATAGDDFHYICGVEVTPYNSAPITLLPMNKEGYVRLTRLITLAKRRAPKGHIVLSLDDILENCEDVIAIPLPPWSEEHLKELQSAFKDRLYIPICKDFSWESVRFYQHALKIEQTLGIQAFATQRPLFHEPERKPLHDILTCILHGTTLNQAATALTLNRERYLKPLDQLASLFKERPDLISRTLEIASRIEFSLTELRYRYPQENLPHGKTAADFLRELVNEGLKWRYPPWTPPEFMSKVRKQVESEIGLIQELEYEDYFLTLWDICQFAREKGILHQGRGSAANSVVCFALGLTSVDPIRLGLLFERFISRERGEPPDIDIDFEHERREEVIRYIYQKYGDKRAAMVCTVICYRSRMAVREVAKVMGVPNAKIDLLVKFMGREGISRLVDAALQRKADGSSAHQERATTTEANRLSTSSAQLSTTQDATSALYDSYGAPAPSTSRALRAPSEAAPLVNQATLDLEALGLNEEKFQKLIRLAKELQGFPRHLGIHSGGFVISHEPIVDIVPVEAASMEGRYVIQWNKDDINTLGLMKIDVLSLGMLTAIRKALDLLRAHKKVDWNLAQIPHEDRPTYEMIQKADTIGVFQIESRAQMSLLPRLKPKTFYDLVIEVAIVRPGPIQGGMVNPYLKRRAGREKVNYAHPSLMPILRKTLGIPLFQEQIMQIAVAVAGFTPGESDELRRVVSSAWKKKAVMDGLRQRVINGMLANGLKQEYAEQVYRTIEGFSSYGFPESHAASFALITYASCYLKKHHPDVFTCALLNSQPMGFYSPRQLIADAQRHGVGALPLDIQHSHWDYTLEPPSPKAITQVKSTSSSPRLTNSNQLNSSRTASTQTNTYLALRTGLRSVYGLREDQMQILIRERQAQGHFRDLTDLIRRTKLPKATLVRLAAAGALNCFGLSVRETLWKLQGLSFDQQSLFFGANTSFEDSSTELSTIPDENEWEEVRREYSSKGFAIDNHPMAVLRPQLLKSRKRYQTNRQLESLRDRTKITITGLLSLIQKPPTAKGMCFLSLEDETGLCNVVVTPDLYQKCRLTLIYSAILEVEGFLEVRDGVRNIKAQMIRPLLLEGSEKTP